MKNHVIDPFNSSGGSSEEGANGDVALPEILVVSLNSFVVDQRRSLPQPPALIASCIEGYYA